MRARTVYENVNFERGQDPRETMGIGDEEIQLIKKLDKYAKKYGFEEAEFEPSHKESGIINIKRWLKPDMMMDDDVEVQLFKQDDGESEPEIYYNTGYSDGQDWAGDWLDDATWEYAFG